MQTFDRCDLELKCVVLILVGDTVDIKYRSYGGQVVTTAQIAKFIRLMVKQLQCTKLESFIKVLDIFYLTYHAMPRGSEKFVP